jgi:hypothetical protein
MKAKTLAHIDLCHAYCWVVRQPDGSVVLTFDERQDSDLRLHGRFGADDDGDPCSRCRALASGATPKHTTRELPDYDEHPDPKESFVHVLAAIGEEDER